MKTLANNSFIHALRKPMALFMVVCLLNGQFLLAIDPTGVNGVTDVPNGPGTDWTVNLSQSGKIIQWNNLDTGPNDSLTFTGAPTAVLNRVHDAVIFNGDLFAAGKQVYIVSPNGVHIGSSATISAAKFIASGLDISDYNFLMGNDVFQPFNIDEGMTMIGQVQNDGTIQVTGDAYLLGSRVLNNGTIVSEGGMVVLATTTGTDNETCIIIGDGSNVAVQTFVPNGDPHTIGGLEDGDVVNKGSISSPSGQIVLAAGDTFAQALGDLDPAMVLADATVDKLNVVAGRQPDITIAGEDKGRVSQNGGLSTVSSDGVNDGINDGLIALSNSDPDKSVTIEDDPNPGFDYKTESGEITVSGSDVTVKAPLDSSGDMTLMSTKDGDVDALWAGASLNAGGDLTVASKKYIGIQENVETPGNIILDAGNQISLVGDLKSTEGSILLSTDEPYNSSTQSPNGSLAVTEGNISAKGDIDIETSLVLTGQDDQVVLSEEGAVTAEGLLYKATTGRLFIISGGPGDEVGVHLKDNVNTNGNFDILSAGDVYLDGDISTIGKAGRGGVLVISTDGKIATDGADGLNIAIHAYSDYMTGEGIQINKDFENVAAIVLISRETLKLDKNAFLHAAGYYLSKADSEFGVDDREPADKLRTPNTVIGGYERNEGIAADLAIYLASIDENVEIVGFVPYTIMVDNYDEYGGPATVVLDAYKAVEFPMMQNMSSDDLMAMIKEYDGEGGGYRLEVISRITEWLSEAIDFNRLPFAANPEIMEALLGNDYVLRGAGQDNPGIANTGETHAWVLEDPQEDIVPVPPLAALEIPELKGCPVEMDAAASELAMNSDDLQLLIGNSLATNPNLQPCKACQKLVTAAAILNDADGARMAAMNEIFNTLAPIDAPFTPEISASIATAFANLSNDDPQYALASEYVNAFVDYVAAIGTDLQVPVGDPVAFTLQKHGDAITGSENPNIAAYIMAQVQSSGGAI